MELKSAIRTKLALAESATDDQILASVEASLAGKTDAEKKLAESEVTSKLLAADVEKLRGELAGRDANHAIELAKTRALEAGLPPFEKQVEDDARELFALGKVDLAKRSLERHLEASRTKIAALGGPTVRLQRDDSPKTPSSKEGVLAKAKEEAAKVIAARPGTPKRATGAK